MLLLYSGKHVHLQCVFHSIRFKVNKGWSTAVLLFLCPYLKIQSKSQFSSDKNAYGFISQRT
ncbi:hypothetical protein B5F91_10035 [Bacteroides sp. An322]|nr:hypothetical protein B5F91_10035 [Bacteroides sp. An322]